MNTWQTSLIWKTWSPETYEFLPCTTVLNAFHRLTHLTFITTLCGNYNYFLHFTQSVSKLTKLKKLMNSRAEIQIWQSSFKIHSSDYHTIVFLILAASPGTTHIFFSYTPMLIFQNQKYDWVTIYS